MAKVEDVYCPLLAAGEMAGKDESDITYMGKTGLHYCNTDCAWYTPAGCAVKVLASSQLQGLVASGKMPPPLPKR